jgi:phosphoglycolate phosphatase
MNKPDLKESELLKFIGPPIQRSFSDLCNMKEDEVLSAVHYYREYFSKNGMIENKVYNEMPELLHELQNVGKKLFFATSKPTVFAKTILNYFHLDLFFAS